MQQSTATGEKNNSLTLYLFIKVNGRLEKIIFDEILFIEGVENYVSIDPENKELIIHATIKGLLERAIALRALPYISKSISCR